VAFLLPDSDVSVTEIAITVDKYANLRLAAWRDALRVLAIQFAALILVATIATLGWGTRVGLGALIGAAIGLLANVYLAIAMLGKPLLSGKQGDVRLNWVIKVVLTLSLLWIAMRAKIVPPPSLIAGLVATMMAQWVAVSYWLFRRR
jgi:F0F1-type ATP synthase assembly protein I